MPKWFYWYLLEGKMLLGERRSGNCNWLKLNESYFIIQYYQTYWNRNKSYAKYFMSPQQLLKIFLSVDLILKDIISTYNIKKFERNVQKSS